MPTKENENQKTDDILAITKIVRTQISAVNRAQKELTNYKDLVADALAVNPNYQEAEKEAKEASKIKADVKRQILEEAKLSETVAKIKELTGHLKETKASLSDYLMEYRRLSGSNQLESENGETVEIVYVAKLKRISSRGV